jgi:hypothetical protein
LAFVLSTFLKFKFRIGGFSKLVFLGVLALGILGATLFYRNGPVHFPAIYRADFIQALPDGSAPFIYASRGQRGRVLAELEIGQKVTVNGITMNYREFNITTADGITGWVERAVFLEDAADMLTIGIDLAGDEAWAIAMDREEVNLVEHLMEKYLNAERNVLIDGVRRPFYSMPNATLNRSIRPNLQTSIMWLDRRAFQQGEDFIDSGDKAIIEGILYAEDCTIIYITATGQSDPNNRRKPHTWRLDGALNSEQWFRSLTVTDLNTGEQWSPLPIPFNTGRTFHEEIISTNPYRVKTSIVFFFPSSMRSRNFSFTFEEPPIIDKKQAGYSGILGRAADLLNLRSAFDYFLNYNFPEVRVR